MISPFKRFNLIIDNFAFLAIYFNNYIKLFTSVKSEKLYQNFIVSVLLIYVSLPSASDDTLTSLIYRNGL